MTTLRYISFEIEDHTATARLGRLAMALGRVIEHPGGSVYGFGKAAVIGLPNGLCDPVALASAREVLTAITPAHEPVGRHVPPVALGALGFLPSAPSFLVVPAVSIRCTEKDGGPASAVIVGPDPRPSELDVLLEKGEPSPAERPPDHFVLTSPLSHAGFLERVEAAVAEIRSGRLDKVVLARDVVVETNRPLRQGDLMAALRRLYPSCAIFGIDGFVGASPELLISRHGLEIGSYPLAGTAARSGDAATDRETEAALLSSTKERAEHRAVVDAIARGLRPATSELSVPRSPRVLRLRNVSHLGTPITGRLTKGGAPSALELVSVIHPTPAVAGYPSDVALEYLAKVEDMDRDRYGGAVGFLDAAGDGDWYLGIRSAVVAADGMTTRLFAGVGVVADSDPEAELIESQLKLQAMLAAAVRP